MVRHILIGVAVIAIVGAAFFAFNSYIYTEKQGTGEVVPYRGELSGEYVCLPLKVLSDAENDECAFGLKTDAGEYFALDFNLTSQTVPQFVLGDRLSASGLITPIEMLSSDQWQKYTVEGIFSVTDSVQKLNTSPLSYMCNGDGKICPDASTVGRTGSDCRFAACPPLEAKEATLVASMGQVTTGLNFSVTPQKLVSDSRCPADVQCIWAGTVEVRTVVATQVGHGEHVFTLGEPREVGDFRVTLTEVSPAKTSTEDIPVSSYRFTYKVEKVR